jgi:hypothetical protein
MQGVGIHNDAHTLVNGSTLISLKLNCIDLAGTFVHLDAPEGFVHI